MGRAAAYRLAAEGARVIVIDRDVEGGQRTIAQIEAQGGSGFFQQVDLADQASIASMADAVAARVDAVHVLINSAGIPGKTWQPTLAINLMAPALVAEALLPLLKKEGGAIVHISSDGGLAGRGGSLVYDASKAGLLSITKSQAVEYWPYGIRVNAIAPGWCVTEFHFAQAPDPAARKKELEAMETDYCLMSRLGRPEEIAAAIAFLASDDASYITATTLSVDGGRVGLALKKA